MDTSHFAGAVGQAGAGQGLTVDIDAILAALEGDERGGEGYTAGELAEMTGKSRYAIDKGLTALHRSGRVRVTTKRIRTRTGNMHSYPAYVFAEGGQ